MPIEYGIIGVLYALVLGAQIGAARQRYISAVCGMKAEMDAMGWRIRSPLYRELGCLHEDQECIEAGDFRPLQGICLKAHFSVKTPRRDIRPLKLETYKRWENNHVSG